MRGLVIRFTGIVSLAVVLFLPGVTVADKVELTPEYFTIDSFSLGGGETIQNMKVEYAVFGKARKDAEDRIVNAVVFCHGWSGNYNQINLFAGAVGPGKPLDPEKYYIICPTALGSPGSSAPSTSGSGAAFPKYTIADMISAQHLLVTQHLGIQHLRGVVGASMGGHQALQWITDYPNMMDWAIAIATGPSTTGRNIGVWGLMSEAIKSDPAYNNGNYTEQPKAGMRRAFMGTYMYYFTHAYFQEKYDTPEAVMKGLENAGLGSEKMDANDVIRRNDAMIAFDVLNDLPKVKAKTMVVGVNTDELFPPDEEFLRVAYALPAATIFRYDSILGHLGCALHIQRANDAMTAFIKSAEDN